MRTAASLALILSTTAFAQQQKFTYDRLLERHDKNNDGIVAKDEFSGNPQMFNRMDQDKDGTIARTEFDSAMNARRSDQRQGSRKGEAGNRFAGVGVPDESELWWSYFRFRPGIRKPDRRWNLSRLLYRNWGCSSARRRFPSERPGISSTSMITR